MTDVGGGVRDHYRATGLAGRLKSALAAFEWEDQQLTPQRLAALDQFYVRGLAATAELAELARITRRNGGSGCRLGCRRAGTLSGRD